MNDPRSDVIAAVKQKLGHATDNLYRARSAFGGMSEHELDEPHGFSGQSRGQVLLEYEQEALRWTAALEYARRLR